MRGLLICYQFTHFFIWFLLHSAWNSIWLISWTTSVYSGFVAVVITVSVVAQDSCCLPYGEVILTSKLFPFTATYNQLLWPHLSNASSRRCTDLGSTVRNCPTTSSARRVPWGQDSLLLQHWFLAAINCFQNFTVCFALSWYKFLVSCSGCTNQWKIWR